MLLLVVSETGLVYTFTTPKLQPLVTKPEGKNLIQVHSPTSHALCLPLTLHQQACLNAPEPADGNGEGGESTVDSPEDSHPVAPQAGGMAPRNAGMPSNAYAMTPDQQQALQYQAYLQQQQQAQQQGGYAMSAPSMAQRH